ncbi:unnamed protein product [Lathyrus oleraceus]
MNGKNILEVGYCMYGSYFTLCIGETCVQHSSLKRLCRLSLGKRRKGLNETHDTTLGMVITMKRSHGEKREQRKKDNII